MKLYIVLFLSVFAMGSFQGLKAEDKMEAEYKNMEQMMGAVHLEKKQVESMLDKMVASGRFSAEDVSKAKRELASMNDNDLENLKTKAIAEVKNKKLLDH